MSLVVSIRRQELSTDELADVITRLSPVLGVSVEELNKRLADKSLSAFTPVPIAENVPEDVVIYLREHQDEFPKVETNTQPTRIYPQAKLASHVLGYLGEIQDDQINSDRYKALDYRPGSIIGRGGIEYAYEKELHGVEGLRKLEVDSSGEVRRILGRKEPERGLDLVTTIDARIQRVTEESLAQGIEKARTIYHEETGDQVQSPGRGSGGHGPSVRRDHRHGVVPRLRPGCLRRGDQRSGVRGADPRGHRAAPDQPGHPGRLPAGVHVQDRDRGSGPGNRRSPGEPALRTARRRFVSPTAPSGTGRPRTRAC